MIVSICSGAKKYLVVQVLLLRMMREVCNFHHRYTYNMKKKKIQEFTL